MSIPSDLEKDLPSYKQFIETEIAKCIRVTEFAEILKALESARLPDEQSWEFNSKTIDLLDKHFRIHHELEEIDHHGQLEGTLEYLESELKRLDVFNSLHRWKGQKTLPLLWSKKQRGSLVPEN
jgi:hypothetical protein